MKVDQELMKKEAETRKKLKIAFHAYEMAFQTPGGGEIQLLKTKEYLQKVGVEVKLFDPWTDKLRSFDILHTFGSVKYALHAIQTARTLGVKTALSTICWYSWKAALNQEFSLRGGVGSVVRHLAKTLFPFLPTMRRKMMNEAQLLFPNSKTEADQLVRYFQIPREKIFIVPNGVDPSFEESRPYAFTERYGLRDFILCIGRIEPRKNQLNVIRALKGIDIPLVFIGDYVPQYREYYEACCREAGEQVYFLGPLLHDSELFASAYAACNTFLLASWLETPGLAALEAGVSGAKVVITNQGAAREYFLDYVTYVSPDNLAQIRAQTLKTYEQLKTPHLREHIRQNYLWSHVAQKTLEGYRRLV